MKRVDVYKLDQGLGFLLRLASARLNNLYTLKCDGYDITPRQFAVLITLYQQGDLTPTELAEHIKVDRSTLSEMLSRMTDRRLIKRIPDPADGRSYRLTILPDGVARVSSLAPLVEVNHTEILSVIPAADRKKFLTYLAAIGQMPDED
ncbi:MULTISPECIES: MarR family transcriptional regulator [unclassified Beijerinckia]|uniref:MarR family winged helix-turn-helix transcriptional regulator n=1 Tax=unclassified Beijerinckia TaxID=2638183 RepID=UPI000897644E|nr:MULTISPECIES: MarR family transcriptional regulator [unclassified Beijerinckia]MDH7793942.1 DNA-binding MarR family transcriptional regulator [Beijerinckia sp. GAS462]SEB49913.1 DNA-binding transcriptional regulator, MarR family [Beijerinckia sp. 28-YEA-48]